jgi:hypothetical protein
MGQGVGIGVLGQVADFVFGEMFEHVDVMGVTAGHFLVPAFNGGYFFPAGDDLDFGGFAFVIVGE